jgi:hypothetical protein
MRPDTRDHAADDAEREPDRALFRRVRKRSRLTSLPGPSETRVSS